MERPSAGEADVQMQVPSSIIQAHDFEKPTCFETAGHGNPSASPPEDPIVKQTLSPPCPC